MTGVTSWVGAACVTGTAAIPPPAARLAGLVGGTAGGPVPGAWIAAVSAGKVSGSSWPSMAR